MDDVDENDIHVDDQEEENRRKRQRLLEELVMTNEGGMGSGDNAYVYDDDDAFRNVKYDELQKGEYSEECYACRHINNASMNENENYLYLMKLYTENVGNVSKEAVYKMIKEYFDEFCYDEDEGETWTLESIREHFDKHTNFPTDELNKQISFSKKLRDMIISSAIYKKGDEVKVNNKNIKDILAIQKDIRELLMMKGKINTMVGYNEILDY